MFTTTVMLEGNLAAKPQLNHTTHKGVPVAEFVVLVNRQQREPGTDNYVDAEPTRHRVKTYSYLAEHVATLDVGTTVILHGRVETEQWTDKETGEPRTGDRVIADAIGASLRFATVDVHKTTTAAAS